MKFCWFPVFSYFWFYRINPNFMKKVVLLSVYLCLCSVVFSESIDSLKAKREKLYQSYCNINIPGKETSRENREKSLVILKDLVIVDTRIISEFADFDNKTKDYDKKIITLNSENKSLTKEISANTDLLFIIYIASGAIVLILIIAVILLFIYMSRNGLLKKKLRDYSDLAKDADNLRIKIQQIESALISKDNVIIEKDTVIKSLLDKKGSMEKQISDYENQLTENLKKQTVPATESKDQNEKVNINMSKIEKLGRMKELGIVTEDEFNTFKQKFLSEL